MITQILKQCREISVELLYQTLSHSHTRESLTIELDFMEGIGCIRIDNQTVIYNK